jgi:septum formation protein
MRLILASTSPRRKDLLSLFNIPFDIVEPTFLEREDAGTTPADQAALYAEGKARSCSERFPNALVLGSDTLIALDRGIVGKPNNQEEARATLRRLRGRDHMVHTAVAFLRHDDGIKEVAIESVRVWMRAFTDREMEAYLESGEPMGKAGAYAIQGQGGRLIARIEGDFTATVGLPLKRVATCLEKFGIGVPVDVAALYRDKPYANWLAFG